MGRSRETARGGCGRRRVRPRRWRPSGGGAVFFGKGEGASTERGVPFVSVEDEILPWIKKQPPEYRAVLFGG